MAPHDPPNAPPHTPPHDPPHTPPHTPPHDPTAYGARIADLYDGLYSASLDTEGAVERLVGLARGGPVLELGVGTGRLALPLAARGLAVHGVEASADMVAALRARPGGAALPVTVADFTDVRVPGEFALVVLAFNTIVALPDQDAQVACFANAARHLRPGGRLVVETWVPDPTAFHAGTSVRPLVVEADRVVTEYAVLDPVTQRMRTTKVHITEEGVRLLPANHRYAWPSELDLMARLAGMAPDERWEDWRGTPFTAISSTHVSVWRLPVGASGGGGTAAP